MRFYTIIRRFMSPGPAQTNIYRKIAALEAKRAFRHVRLDRIQSQNVTRSNGIVNKGTRNIDVRSISRKNILSITYVDMVC